MRPVVYIMASKKNGVLYIGVTSNLKKRIWQHRHNEVKGFTEQYFVHRLVYYEQHSTMSSAIQREKQIKKWKRQWKINLIEENNPGWRDLFDNINEI